MGRQHTSQRSVVRKQVVWPPAKADTAPTKFGSDFSVDDATRTQRGYEMVYYLCNWGFWERKEGIVVTTILFILFKSFQLWLWSSFSWVLWPFSLLPFFGFDHLLISVTTRCCWLVLCFHSPRTSHFSKDPWILSLENRIKHPERTLHFVNVSWLPTWASINALL